MNPNRYAAFGITGNTDRNGNVGAFRVLGEEWAEARGVETSRLTLAGYVAGSLLT